MTTTATLITVFFAQQHQTDQRLPDQHREGYTLLLATRSWEYEVFTRFKR
jgi:hypothetical protein